MRVGRLGHYIIMIFMYKTFAILYYVRRYHYYRLVTVVRALDILISVSDQLSARLLPRHLHWKLLVPCASAWHLYVP